MALSGLSIFFKSTSSSLFKGSTYFLLKFGGSSWPWLYGICSWIYNYLCNQCPSPLKLFWVRIQLRPGVLDTTLCDKVCQWLAADQWFSQGSPVSSTNKSDCHDIAEILLKVALNTIDPYILLPILGDNLLHYELSRVLYNLLPVLGDNLLHYGLSRVLYEDKIWDITFQILEALNYLHSKQIRHSDVKRKFFLYNHKIFAVIYDMVLSLLL